MMKQIKIIEPDGFKHGGEDFHCGDTITHKDGQYFIDLGWAEDPETGKSGERVVGVSKIKPDNIIQDDIIK